MQSIAKYLYGLTTNPTLKYEPILEVIRDFRKGGLNPTNYAEIIQLIKGLPPIIHRPPSAYSVFEKFNLLNISETEFQSIMNEVRRRAIEKNKKCWHPKASSVTCNIDNLGNIIVSAAHSIQNNGALKRISQNGIVLGYELSEGELKGGSINKNVASIFWGFCNTHDTIFGPIENHPYTQTEEQNFLFAYRAFIFALHNKFEISTWMNFGIQAENDIIQTKKIFNAAIDLSDFFIIETEVFELPAFYPIAVSSTSDLEFDFEGNPISHSDQRMENIYITFFPMGNKSYFLISYLKKDKQLYGHLGNQLRGRKNLKLDISILIASHAENIYFNPTYYKTFIEKQEETLMKIIRESMFDRGTITENDEVIIKNSLTPSNYLNNPYGINLFGY